jgi:ribonuclease D
VTDDLPEVDEEGPPPAPLPPVELRAGLPQVVADADGLRAAAADLARGEGPVAVDAERASGFRYGQRAYLLQFYRRPGTTWLIDPMAVTDLAPLAEVLRESTWILHAASQDLPCLREVGLAPQRLFDTELAARLLGRERVGLGPLVESELGLHLAKGHGAADWSTRPLPDSWLRYAALDVEVLIDLYDILEVDLRATGKLPWAEQEFVAVLGQPPSPPRRDPWRRTSGLHHVRGRRPLAIVRALWSSRDDLAREMDISPGRILTDAAIVAAATQDIPDRATLAARPEFRRSQAARHLDRWWQAIQEGRSVPEPDLPPATLPSDVPPPPRLWRDRDPIAADRLARAREILAKESSARNVPVENILPPDALRRWAWDPPMPIDSSSVAETLQRWGARPWQTDLLAGPIAEAVTHGEPSA